MIMNKRRLSIIAASIILLPLFLWFALPREMKNLIRFGSWREAHVRAAGQVAREPGTQIAWEEFGTAAGSPVLVLHGGLTTTTVMIGIIETLAAASFRVIAIDSRGHGKSTNGAEQLSYEMMADDVVAVLDALKIDRAAVVGWSDGGNIALDLARRYGQRTTKIVAIGANHRPAPEGMNVVEVQMFKDAEPDSALFWPMRRMYESHSPTPEKWATLFRQEQRLAFTEPNWSLADLSLIAVPVLFISGEHDLLLLPYATNMKNAIRGARLEVIAGETHMLPVANPAAVAPLMLAFLGPS